MCGCTGGGEGEGHEDPHVAQDREEPGQNEEHAAEAVRLSPEMLEEFDIQVLTAGSGWIEKTVVLPAEVRPNQDRLAHIVPRFPGIVKEVRKQIGDSVRAGDTLAVVESSESLAPYALKTLIDGIVIAKHATRGEPVSPETEVFVVADLREVWVDISAYQKHLSALKLGQPVIVSGGPDLPEAQGTLSYIAPVVDEHTRTVTARVVLPNPEGRWRPGMFVTARVQVERTEVSVAVPKTALEVIEQKTVVFVQEKDRFQPRRITIGRQGKSHVEIRSGLIAGERFVSRGGFTLKAELGRGELSSGHGP
jgi:cobalt-zinc-cadmium efflux system membrane fusion protein